jgi:hypothetical protein
MPRPLHAVASVAGSNGSPETPQHSENALANISFGACLHLPSSCALAFLAAAAARRPLKKINISLEYVSKLFRKSAGLASTAGCYILVIAGYTTVTSSSQTYPFMTYRSLRVLLQYLCNLSALHSFSLLSLTGTILKRQSCTSPTSSQVAAASCRTAVFCSVYLQPRQNKTACAALVHQPPLQQP